MLGLHSPTKVLDREVPVTDSESRLKQEINRFSQQENIHDLPSVYDYWSETYLRPRIRSTGYNNFHDMFIAHIDRTRSASGSKLQLVSIGSGNCDFEIVLAKKMVEQGINDFELSCFDINDVMLERGREAVQKVGLDSKFEFLQGDFNTWVPDAPIDIVLANQSLHHVTELEHLFDVVQNALNPHGHFLISDMIGRNGHMRWPEAEDYIQRLWATLPREKKYHHQLKKTFDDFYNHDCSNVGFEGIRAQDILPLLIERFHFAYFLAFSVLMAPFIGRGYGQNYDIRKPQDKRFIDDVAVFEQALIDAGILKPVQMFAALTKERLCEPVHDRHLTPQFCLRLPQ